VQLSLSGWLPRSAAIGLAVVVLGIVGLRYMAASGDTAALTDRPIEETRDGYVTSETCRACHPSNYASWHGSYHRRMTQAASPAAIVADFEDVDLQVAGQHYRLGRSGDDFWVELGGTTGSDAERRRIVMTTGSHHRQWVWYAAGDDRRLGTIPFIYLIDRQRWVPSFAAFLLPPDPAWTPSDHEGLWGAGCVSCHTTHGERRGPTGEEPQVVEFGISCEACHGPADEHVRLNRDPRHRYGLHWNGERDSSIVNPRHLSNARSSEICGQCHSIWAAEGAFRPGDDLTAVSSGSGRKSPLPEASEWSDGMQHTGGREYDVLIETPCFQSGSMSCLSCHSMHKSAEDPRSTEEWANDQLQPEMQSDQACVQCHDTDAETHTHHAPESSGSRCYNCHMPHTSYALLKAIRTHYVVGPSVSSSVETGRPNACNLCHLDRSLGWTADHLAEWYEIPRPTLTEDQEKIAAAVLWTMTGHAGQRALIGWHMGWQPARQASGTGWLAPYLTLMMNDLYPAVRIIAYRSISDLAGFEAFPFDYVGTPAEREIAVRNAVEIWRKELAGQTKTGDAILIRPDGSLDEAEFIRLVGERDNRPVYWIE
jgi:hypothetical protein